MRRDLVRQQLKRLDQVLARFRTVYPASFLMIMDLVLKLEGGFSASNHDGAGATLFGLTSEHHSDLADKIRSGTLTIEQAVTRYHDRYWVQLPSISELSPGLAFFIFDSYIQGCAGYCISEGLLAHAGILTEKTTIKDGVIGVVAKSDKRRLIAGLKDMYDKPQVLGSIMNAKVMNRAKRKGIKPVSQLAGLSSRVKQRAIMALNLEGVFV